MRFVFRQVKRAVAAAALLAATFVVSVPVTYAVMLARFRGMRNRGAPCGPGFEPPGERSMEDAARALAAVPFEPVRPQALGFLKGALNNSFLLFLNTTRATAARFYPYPGEFREVVFESFDGTPLTGALGLHDDGRPRPGLVLSHGFMGSKNDHYIVDTALTAFAGWGYNVLAVDLRNFGRSQCHLHCPTTAGWKEGEDLLAGARFLGGQGGVTTVGLTGFSMGAGSTMRAAYMAREHPYLTGGAVAWNGYADARRMVEHISTRPAPGHPFFPVYLSFRLMHRLRRGDMKEYITAPDLQEYLCGSFHEADFMSYMEKITAPHYGVTTDELFENASSESFLGEVETPLLVIHAADDPVCPPSEMDPLMRIAEENPNVHVWMLPAGNHCLFRYLDRGWYESVLRGFFDYWAAWE